jgi:hypothetical protein
LHCNGSLAWTRLLHAWYQGPHLSHVSAASAALCFANCVFLQSVSLHGACLLAVATVFLGGSNAALKVTVICMVVNLVCMGPMFAVLHLPSVLDIWKMSYVYIIIIICSPC